MATTATSLYALNINQAVEAVAAIGNTRTVLIEGDMGSGKSSILWTLAKKFPNHLPCYFDCTTKDLGDITIPKLLTIEGDEDAGFVRYVTNEELGLHNNRDIILMIDEYGKANVQVKNALLRLMLERKLGSYTLTPASFVFATTNLGGEGVGDMMLPHQRNRVSVVRMRKPTSVEWIEWGINNGIDPIILGWCKDNPHLFQSFTEIDSPYKDRNNAEPTNPYIYHPQVPMDAFVTPRSLHAASDIVKLRDKLDRQTLTSLLIGTIGARGAMDLATFITMADQLPTQQSIKDDPMTAKVPESAAAVCMVVHRALSTIERTWVDAWMDYLLRLDKEAQGMFANGVRAESYDKAKRSMVMTSKKFRDWAMANNYLFVKTTHDRA